MPSNNGGGGLASRVRHDPEKAARLLNDCVHALQDDPETARAVPIAKLKRVAGDREAAGPMVRIALAVGYADGRFNTAQRRPFAEFRETPGRDPKEASLA